MIRLAPGVSIDERDLVWQFARASGPGGQNVNKVESAVLLRFDLGHPALPTDLRDRLIKLAGHRVTKDGVLIIQAQRFRSQERNRQDAIERLVALTTAAHRRPVARIATRPTRGAKKKRLADKANRSQLKQNRRRPAGD